MAMKISQIIANTKKYEAHIRNQIPGGVTPVRHDFTGQDLKKNMEHALFMTLEIRAMCESVLDMGAKRPIDPKDTPKLIFAREKIMRWLGWLQCSMCFFGLYSLEDLKKDNMPPGEEFKPDGGSQQLTKTDREIRKAVVFGEGYGMGAEKFDKFISSGGVPAEAAPPEKS